MKNKKITFRQAIQRGLGRSVITLKRAADTEPWREDVLWACRHNVAYDAQCEGNRSLQLYEMIQCFHDAAPFLQVIEERMRICRRSSGWEFDRDCELLSFFAMDGNEQAQRVLDENYAALYNILLKKRKRGKNGLCPEVDNYEFLCVHTASHTNSISESIDRCFMYAEDMGRLNLKNRVFAAETFPWFQAVCEDRIGEKRLWALLEKRSAYSPGLARYLDLCREEKTSFETCSEDRKTYETADDIFNRIKQNEPWRSCRLVFMHLERQENEEELQRLANYYRDEKDEKIREKLLRLFSIRENVKYLDIKKVLADAISENGELKNAAMGALSGIKSEAAREFALKHERSLEFVPYLISVLAKNYRPCDKALLSELIVQIKEVDRHSVFGAVMDIFKDKTIKDPPRELLLYMYETNPCSCCRFYTVREMGRRRMLEKWMLIECLYDCNTDIREYARKALKRRENRQSEPV